MDCGPNRRVVAFLNKFILLYSLRFTRNHLPIFRTTNFVHRNPNVCVSIALSVNRQVVLGVVYAPLFDEMFISVRGRHSKLFYNN